MLCEIGAHYPGLKPIFTVHTVRLMAAIPLRYERRKQKIISSYKGSGLPLPFLLIRRTHENTLTAARDILYLAIQIWEYFSFYGMRALLILISPISLVLMITMPSACSAHIISGLRYPYSRRLACRPPARHRTAVIAGALLMTLGHVVLGLIQIQLLACIWRWQSLFVATFIQIKHQLFAWRALRRERS